MKSIKSNSSPEPEEIQSMVCYARNLIEEFRKAKHYKNILFPPTFPMIDSCFVIWFFCFFPFSVCCFVCIYGEFSACFSSSAMFYSLTLWHPQVSYWKCASWAWIKWEAYLQTPTSTCCTWCTRPWACVCTCRIGMEPWATERRLFSPTGKTICKSDSAYRYLICNPGWFHILFFCFFLLVFITQLTL